MNELRAGETSECDLLPPVSRRALAVGQPWRVLEARSFAYGLLVGYRASLFQVQQRLKSREAAFATGSGAAGNVVYQWARGESVPRRAQAVIGSRRRAWLDVIGEELPDVARRVGHPVWRALTARLISDPTVYSRLLGELPRPHAALFADGARASTRARRLEPTALREALATVRDDADLANFFAAYVLWRRWRNHGVLFTREKEPPARAVQTEIVAAFANSSWVCPDDRTRLESAFDGAVIADIHFRRLLSTDRKAWNATAPRVSRRA
jgi:hypothetical protein